MIVLGWVAVVGIPLIVFIAAVLWPERIPKDRTVEAIRKRVEVDDQRNRHGDNGRRWRRY
ncbi:hypothetical protein AB0L63_28145 [Nocardia sp. NPDC051990]|uniref:hypothetical protein n=1 Tax=Nocardia sp. NPDC051990 TaxID=3155285 RepID=UPI0034261F76